VVLRVVVQPEKIDLDVSRNGLRTLLMNDKFAGSGRAEFAVATRASSDDLIRLCVKVSLKRCGGEMRLVLNPDWARSEAVTPIAKAIARAHTWREGVLSADHRLVSKQLEFKGEYLRRVLGCAFLAPDIVEAILDGHSHAGLTLKKLTRRRLPLDWAEQRIRLGFPAPTRTHQVVVKTH
jgi:hypothetical protein